MGVSAAPPRLCVCPTPATVLTLLSSPPGAGGEADPRRPPAPARPALPRPRQPCQAGGLHPPVHPVVATATNQCHQLLGLLRWGGEGRGRGGWEGGLGVLRPPALHTTLLQMVPSSSISQRTSSPGCQGQGHTGSSCWPCPHCPPHPAMLSFLCPPQPSPSFPLTFRNTGGFRKNPTPAGVPVSRMSPGTSVTNLGGETHTREVTVMAPPGPPRPSPYRETQAMSLERGKMSCWVLLSCISCPLTLQRMPRLWTSVGTEGTRHTAEGGDTKGTPPHQWGQLPWEKHRWFGVKWCVSPPVSAVMRDGPILVPVLSLSLFCPCPLPIPTSSLSPSHPCACPYSCPVLVPSLSLFPHCPHPIPIPTLSLSAVPPSSLSPPHLSLPPW